MLFFSKIKHLVWSDEHLHIQIWYHTQFYRTLVLAYEQAPLWSGLKSGQNFWYRLQNQIWSAPWYDKDLVRTKWDL